MSPAPGWSTLILSLLLALLLITYSVLVVSYRRRISALSEDVEYWKTRTEIYRHRLRSGPPWRDLVLASEPSGSLPPFPVDNVTLSMLWTAIHPGPDEGRSSVEDLLTLMSEMGGSSTTAARRLMPAEGAAIDASDVRELRDPNYCRDDVIAALVQEVVRLRRDLGTS